MSERSGALGIDEHQRAMRVLRAALDADDSTRDRVLEDLCAGNAALRSDVESLLDSHRRAGTFLETPAVSTDFQSLADEFDGAAMLIGRRIGRYTVRALLGRGGMGAVFLAQQDEPLRD